MFAKRVMLTSLVPGSNSKFVSALFKSKSKSYLVSQYGASLITSLTSVTSFSNELDNT